jgi:uncharacterized YigZ family protein
MEKKNKSFKTISRPAGPVLLREKKSKFLGLAFPAASVADAEATLSSLRKDYADASHVCYAYRIGIEQPLVRMNDDGEPAYTAGSPILGQITSVGLYDILVCVVRYYGGTKLGAGGLTQAYREAARGVLGAAPVIRLKSVCLLRLRFGYPSLDDVMGFISQNRLEISHREMGLDCTLELVVPPAVCEGYLLRLRGISGLSLTVKEGYR